MDEAVGEELNETDAAERSHTRGKANDYMLKPGGSSVVGSTQISTHHEGFYNQMSTHLLTDILEGKNLDRIGSSEHDSSSLYGMDEVTELTLRNYNGENLPVVASSSRDRLQSPQNQWQLFHQITGGLLSGSQGEAASKDASQSDLKDLEHLRSSSVLNQDQKTSYETYKPKTVNFLDNDRDVLSFDSAVNRTKMLSKSGYSEYFIKSTLKGKGVIHRGPMQRRSGDLADSRSFNARNEDSDAPLALSAEVLTPPSHSIDGTLPCFSTHSHHDGAILRDWLENGQNMVDKSQNLLIFRHIVELVDISHSQGVALKDLRPSCFKLLRSNQVLYLGSSFHVDLSKLVLDQNVSKLVHDRNDKKPLEQELNPFISHGEKRQKFDDKLTYNGRRSQYPFSAGLKSPSLGVVNTESDSGPEYRGASTKKLNPWLGVQSQNVSCMPQASDVHPELSTAEENWYTSPEKLNHSCSALSSNIYSLGVLLFELLGSFGSRRSREEAMRDLRQRILPPDFLSGNPKEAGFCLWLLHPEPSSRPLTKDILQSEVLTGIQKFVPDASLSSIDEEAAETELLLHFLSSLREKSGRDASKLAEELRCIEADIQEVERRRMKRSTELLSLPESFVSWETRLLNAHTSSDVHELPSLSDEKLRRNIRQLESAYFTMRSNIQLPENERKKRTDQELLRARERRLSKKDEPDNDRFGGFFSDLCKYARYSRFKVQGILRNGDFSNSSNVICSLSFDRDEDYLATGGVSKKIKIFDFNTLFDLAVDIHYPVIEMSNKSRLSCVCWNSYIRNYLASTDYDGVVKLWDAATGQGICEFIEHDQRAWCVDFSRVDPTKLASGSDDRLVKIWSINEKNSLCSIGSNANVCSVQFSAHSTYLLAFSSADFKTYCYDLRNVSTPWCILAGHEKAVSYAKFLDSETLVSASIDNTLKVWDLKKTNPNGLSRDACILTLRGHTNEKNFVGLSVADGYIACGSETNEVFTYFRSLPMPITSHKFGSIDPISGKETDDDNGHFVSSVCWRRKSDMVVAANSTGSIKLLQMV